ncbi:MULTISPECIES: glycerol-3-phosphate 1-O-acyltransferase PlsY [unclassified Campylobacter]|uniref:glycerol-3-phosphate 1-O-acyltransferase PlsY n=1 Tax=unclassified Campylobacter TaxID=2593542 RepID=UPI0012383AA1|nr:MULTISPECIES: glycerol-3-phosphate 1-O-acyltransferase PlsY [unclassified Campylobacter]KAA6227126.1 glycerol-3-phosphate 1-O-acyltransferase PlsY [Campylobacter sp. LR185c]KAA6227477.1 glycerol-3-phosphate 1-O-acyltransferase PlsY [Campylobacter sp. LR196d]KAA6228503.1 glycerol-3-phosphate 1-O-acyltransferase PlsY [Campylobacter sp. LR286c]KAA6230894.1 glycerol-3-phosphate 1-O-acyltransferase PlsY [Campylobacter sp. LR291e]KAA6233528.1 glycerol-3-phosphate 1-O-acyltransferase PlsY [Campylo
MENLIIYALAYLIGSIPFGLIIAKKFANLDIRKDGSQSIGATNVLRVVKKNNPKLAKKLAIATILLDFAKAFIPLLVMKVIGFDEGLLWSVAVLLILGHCFSIYLLFDGGKGIATGVGAMLVMLPLEALSALFAWFIIGKIFKISSLASLVAIFTFIICSFIYHYEMPVIDTHAPVIIIVFIIFYKHIPNIKRLVFKEECKVI